VGIAVVLFYFQYKENLTNTFISLDPNAGNCSEVPQTVTGKFMSDIKGNWITNTDFSYILNSYSVNLLGLQYTNARWSRVMTEVTAQVKVVGEKGANRDYAWNMVVWSSFTANFKTQEEGSMTFSSEGRAGIIFNKEIGAIQAGSRVGSNSSKVCDAVTSYNFDPVSSFLNLETELQFNGHCAEGPPCQLNPCPGILAPQVTLITTLTLTDNSNQ
jgi:hypothetical protein